MQSGGGAQQGSGHGRSAAASPASSSSGVSAPQLGLDQQQQQQQQQHQHQRQTLQQQFLRRSEGNDSVLAYQSAPTHDVIGMGNFNAPSGSLLLSQQQRKYLDFGQQQVPSGVREDGQGRSQGFEQQLLNPMHQAYINAFQAAQQKSAAGTQSQPQMKPGIFSPPNKEDLRMGSMKVPAANQSQASSSKKSTENLTRSESQSDHGQRHMPDHRTDAEPSTQPTLIGQAFPVRPMMQPQQAQHNIQNMTANPIALASQMQAFALEHNIDLSLPANANMVAQLMQYKLASQQRGNENSTSLQALNAHVQKQPVSPAMGPNESSPRGNASSDALAQSNTAKSRYPSTSAPTIASPNSAMLSNAGSVPMQQFSPHGRDNQLASRQGIVIGNGMPPMPPPQASLNLKQGVENAAGAKSTQLGSESRQMQYVRQPSLSSPQSTASSSDGALVNPSTSQGGNVIPVQQQHQGFTKQQLHVLKAQILAFRRIKKGDATLPRELLQAIAPPPLEMPIQPVPPPSGTIQEKSVGKNIEVRVPEPGEKSSQLASPGDERQRLEKEVADESVATSVANAQSRAAIKKEPTSMVPLRKDEHQASGPSTKCESEVEHVTQKVASRNDISADRGKAIAAQPNIPETELSKKTVHGNSTQTKDVGSSRKYHGPLFDFPAFTRKHDAFGSALMMNTNNNLALAYDIKDLLAEEGVEFFKRKRQDSIRKIGNILAVNLERKRIRPDLIVRMQIEEKKLQLADVQARLRDEIEQQQQDIMAMPERPYRKFVRLCERQRQEMTRQVHASQKAVREKQLKSIFQWRKKLLETHWAIRDARTARNRGVAKYHERMLREFSKRKDDDRNKRMEALKNNDVERYREMLLEQQTSIPGEAAERYAVLSSFLSQTEEYLHRLGNKITAAKNQQEVEEAANAAAAAARAQGLSEEEVRSAAACAREEVMIRNRFSEMNAPKENSSVNKYYNLAHAVNERVVRQPSMLRKGTLRDYQLVGLQWMLSLYNNKLNGILADEMGLGKTVQVMSLIAYLMEFKGNYGPHLIIVPNAVLVNWKSELHNWLPSVSCIYYVGGKEQRAKLFSQEVSAMKFNVLVTTYEFIMFDRSKLSKVDWKYIIIDEAQRMKDRESVLARDLDKYRCQRRLLLTGTPLQNDLKELWSLLNLLLPEVFDNRKAFHDWFSQPFQKEGPSHNAEDDWLETEKKVIIIHRLHQILEPFMLRRRVEDVEGSLPPKVSIVLRCRMSAIQSAIYDWIKSTGTIRVDPEDEIRKAERNAIYQVKAYKPLNNRCMELRKACNHPLLNYPYYGDLSKDFLVRSCGKLWILDRILIKLQRTGHRVLLFSTMTKLLDILEEYLQWRRLVYRRIDGTTSLEDRESAIVDFNRPNTDCFIFLLSIRAAGRGLNLQTADTVIIYDPDPNPKNEEQAVARAHRIGQTREVKVIYMEAVVDKISSHQKEDELRNGGTVESDDDLAGKDRYMGSIESLIRNNIQQYKIDMADEVINAGRFDQRTTHEERRMTLETLLHDEERYQETVHDVPSLQEVNRMIARSEEEVELFDQMDEELDWAEEMTKYDQVPKWLRANTKEVNAAIANLSKKPSKTSLYGEGIAVETKEEGEKKRGRPRKVPIYTELDDDDGEFSEASSEERNVDSAREEEGEIGEFEDDDFNGAGGAPQTNKDQSEDDIAPPTGGYGYSRPLNNPKDTQMHEEAGSSGSSLDGRRSTRRVSPSLSSQKFGSLSALDARPSSHSKKLADELEEGEIAVSGDSPMDIQQSGSWNQDRDEGEEEQVLQPRTKRKRSIRLRPRHVTERSDEKPSLRRGDSLVLSSLVDQKYEPQLRNDRGRKMPGEPVMLKQEQVDSSMKNRRNMNLRKLPNTAKVGGSLKSGRVVHSDESIQTSRENSDTKVVHVGGRSSGGSRMNEVIQKKCKNVISKLRKRIDREGPQIIPLLTDLWKRIASSGCIPGTEDELFDLSEIGMRLDNYEYGGVMEFVSDVQLMLKSAMQFYGLSYEVRSEARKVHDLFFDLLKIVFPDVDFREARNSLFFNSPPSSSAYGSASKHVLPGQNKRQKPLSAAEPEPSRPQKPQTRGMIHEDTKSRVHVSQKESRVGSSSSRDTTAQQDDTRPFPHPGELVICKKKRKDREKLGLRPGSGSAGPISPTGISRGMRSPAGPSSVAKDGRLNQQVTQQQARNNNQSPQQVNGSGGSVGWANPVKRMRTDAGKRRPSHL
ncbi:OLC1v1039276C1 [Oldenlandia corymbosa var. corymbosa]|uniref:OLC1v1039276C1 n=1 Tax=Oldenlandia corymbosa var. corymbosa TaxID=529605 RepID=A0AAV1D1S4_OLDCO|nr:OLC1v1039276C1 [Oldenlandia corymbosa var. corymbosa]